MPNTFKVIFEEDRPKKRDDKRVPIPAALFHELSFEAGECGFLSTSKYIQQLLNERHEERSDDFISRALSQISQGLYALKAAIEEPAPPLKPAEVNRLIGTWEVLCRDLQEELRK